MAASAAFLVAAVVAGGVAASSANKAPKMPNPADTAPKADPVGDTKKADGAAEQVRKRNAAAAASGSTILTGPQGLGAVAPDQQDKKSLLGY